MSSSPANKNYLKEVREQYEEYPYPPRKPEDEKTRLMAPMTESLDWMNYYCFAGKKDFSKEFRALVAGGGTGDGVVYLAEQLRDTDADIVYLDISKASMEVAQARAKARGLDNITWIESSLLDIPQLDLGEFDYINCSGVLHHLESPEAGLAAIASVLKDDGAMGIMLYAKYGRTGVYQMQELMQIINQDEQSQKAKVENCWTALESLEQNHWHKAFYPDSANKEKFSNIDIYDLYLHSQDRPYTVLETYDFIESQNLNIIHFLASKEKQGNKLYRPETYIKDQQLLNKVLQLDERRQQAIAEVLHGHITKHTFYVGKTIAERPSIDNLDNVPFLTYFFPPFMYEKIYHAACEQQDRVHIGVPEQNKGVVFKKTPHAEELLKHIDGERTLGDIFSNVIVENPQATNEILLEEFRIIFGAFNIHNWMLLRDKSVPRFLTLSEMEQRLSSAS